MWRCPACQTPIAHDSIESRPGVEGAYRCAVCRLDLRYNADIERMEIAPLETDHAVAGDPKGRARSVPLPLPSPPPKPTKRRG